MGVGLTVLHLETFPVTLCNWTETADRPRRLLTENWCLNRQELFRVCTWEQVVMWLADYNFDTAVLRTREIRLPDDGRREKETGFL
jgi:hypothetical protein